MQSGRAGGRGPHTDTVDLRSRRLWYGWAENSQGMEPPLDAFFLGDLPQRFTVGKKSAAAVGCHACTPERPRLWHRQRRPERGLVEPRLGHAELTPAGGYAYAVVRLVGPAAHTGRPHHTKKRQRFALGESVVLLLPSWQMAYTRRGDATMQRYAAPKKLRKRRRSSMRRWLVVSRER